jgi:hypothetical protein
MRSETLILVAYPAFPFTRREIQRIARVAGATFVELHRHNRTEANRTFVATHQVQLVMAHGAAVDGSRAWRIGLTARRTKVRHVRILITPTDDLHAPDESIHP